MEDKLKITNIWKVTLLSSIDIALRYPIEGIYKTVTKKYPWSVFFQNDFISKAPKEFGGFKIEISNALLLNDISIENFYNHLMHEFSHNIMDYFEWYEAHKNQTILFGSYNPYEQIFLYGKETLKYIEGIKEQSGIKELRIKKGIKENKSITSFNVSLNKHELEFIYRELTQSNHFIDDTVTTIDDFVNVFTKDWNDLQGSVIQFHCDTMKAAYILRKFIKYSSCFSLKNIEGSKLFISGKKDKKPFKADNLSKAYNDFIKLNKDPSIIDQIFDKAKSSK